MLLSHKQTQSKLPGWGAGGPGGNNRQAGTRQYTDLVTIYFKTSSRNSTRLHISFFLLTRVNKTVCVNKDDAFWQVVRGKSKAFYSSITLLSRQVLLRAIVNNKLKS